MTVDEKIQEYIDRARDIFLKDNTWICTSADDRNILIVKIAGMIQKEEHRIKEHIVHKLVKK